jgi:hypothetical protein
MSSTAGSEEGRISRSNFRKHEADEEKGAADDPRVLACACPCCGGRMIIIENLLAGMQPTWPVTDPIRIDPHDRQLPRAKPFTYLLVLRWQRYFIVDPRLNPHNGLFSPFLRGLSPRARTHVTPLSLLAQPPVPDLGAPKEAMRRDGGSPHSFGNSISFVLDGKENCEMNRTASSGAEQEHLAVGDPAS